MIRALVVVALLAFSVRAAFSAHDYVKGIQTAQARAIAQGEQ